LDFLNARKRLVGSGRSTSKKLATITAARRAAHAKSPKLHEDHKWIPQPDSLAKMFWLFRLESALLKGKRVESCIYWAFGTGSTQQSHNVGTTNPCIHTRTAIASTQQTSRLIGKWTCKENSKIQCWEQGGSSEFSNYFLNRGFILPTHPLD
jgi:hypothetical protein